MKCTVHSFVLITTNRKKKVYKCQNCPFYVTPDMAVGHKQHCKFCGTDFILDPITIGKIRIKKYPNCGCLNTKHHYEVKKVQKKEVTIKGKEVKEEPIGNILDDILTGKI